MKNRLTGATRWFLLVTGVLAVACSVAPTVGTVDGELPLGTWGGDSAGMIVSDTALHLHVGCTFGDVSGTRSRERRWEFRGGRQLYAARLSHPRRTD